MNLLILTALVIKKTTTAAAVLSVGAELKSADFEKPSNIRC